MKLSIIIPAYNEADVIKNVIDGLKQELANLNLEEYEIIVVNDASTDNTWAVLERIEKIKIVNHPYNKGNGAAIKTGAKIAQYDWLLTFDSDGQHQPGYIKEMLKYTDNFDLITGERVGYQGPWVRQPGKKVIHWLARYLLGQKIKDFNCGMRLVKKNEFLRFTHLLPDGFSWCTTSLFAFYKEKLNVKFVPITINKRESGKSRVKPDVAFVYLMLILRLVMLFSPLRFFLPISLFLFVLAVAVVVYDLLFLFGDFHNTTIGLLTFSSLMIFFFGLLADQVAALRREIKIK